MRIVVLTLLLTAAATAGAAAQDATTTPPPRQESDVPEGLLPEPAIVGRAVEFGSRLLGSDSSQKDGFYPDFGDMVTGAGWISIGPGTDGTFSTVTCQSTGQPPFRGVPIRTRRRASN